MNLTDDETGQQELNRLTHELDFLNRSIKEQLEEQESLKTSIGSFETSKSVYARNIRTEKMKARDLQHQCKAIMTWLSKDAHVRMEREKDIANSILARVAKLFEKLTVAQEKSYYKLQVYNDKFEVVAREYQNIVVCKIKYLLLSIV
jgi:chromosome segregation ATPase